ncbi:MAG: DUF2029 domain-containing protein [Actinobacteria bacterium]|nr:DUF2029 domain-containing protein [Actinomycetota bacterium]
MKAVLPVLLIILGAAVCFHEAFVFSNPGRDSDFAVYFAAAKVAADGGDPYSRSAVGGELSRIGAGAGMEEYLYSSSFLVFLQPLVSMGIRNAHRVFELATYLAVAASTLLIWRSVNLRAPRRLPLWVPVALLVWFTPFWSNIALTQANGIILLLLSVCFYFNSRRHDFRAGAALAGAVAIKFPPILLLLYFVCRRRWRALAGAAITGAALEAVSWIYFGSFLDLGLPASLLNHASSMLFYWDNMALPAMLARPLGQGSAWASPVTLVTGAVIAAATLLVMWRRRGGGGTDQLQFALFITAALLIPNLLFDHHLIQLLIPLSVILTMLAGPLSGLRQSLLLPLIAVLGFSFVLIEVDFWRVWNLSGMESWGWWAHLGSWGLLLLWGLQMYMLAAPEIYRRLEAPASPAGP